MQSARLVDLTILWTLTATTSGFASDLSQPGPHAPGVREVTIVRPDGTAFTAKVFYPAIRLGRDVPVDRIRGPFCPVIFDSIVFPPAYRSTLSHLATWGFVVLMPDFALSQLPDTQAMADDIGYSLEFLIAESSRPDSPFYRTIRSDRCGFSGHSLGSGCSIIRGLVEGPRLKVVANLACGNRTVPPATAVAGQLPVPLIMLAGTHDDIAPLDEQVGPVYQAAMPAKALFALDGATHMQFTDSVIAPHADGDMPQDEQLAISRTYLTAAFRLYLTEQDDLWPMLWDPGTPPLDDVMPTIDSGIVWQTSSTVVFGISGQTIEFSATVSNQSPQPQGLELFADGSSLPATISPNVIGDLPPGGTAAVTIRGRVDTQSQTVRLSARSTRDGHTRGVRRVTIRPL
jgi:hypothetical protein